MANCFPQSYVGFRLPVTCRLGPTFTLALFVIRRSGKSNDVYTSKLTSLVMTSLNLISTVTVVVFPMMMISSEDLSSMILTSGEANAEKQKQEGQDGPVSLTRVPDVTPEVGPFYPRDVIWASQLDTSNEVSSQLSYRFRRRSSKNVFKMATVAAILIFQAKRF